MQKTSDRAENQVPNSLRNASLPSLMMLRGVGFDPKGHPVTTVCWVIFGLPHKRKQSPEKMRFPGRVCRLHHRGSLPKVGKMAARLPHSAKEKEGQGLAGQEGSRASVRHGLLGSLAFR